MMTQRSHFKIRIYILYIRLSVGMCIVVPCGIPVPSRAMMPVSPPLFFVFSLNSKIQSRTYFSSNIQACKNSPALKNFKYS